MLTKKFKQFTNLSFIYILFNILLFYISYISLASKVLQENIPITKLDNKFDNKEFFFYEDIFDEISTPLDNYDEINTYDKLKNNYNYYYIENNGLPILHSNIGSKNIIFLDFDGYNHTRRFEYGWHNFSALPYDPLNDDPSSYNPIFTEKEQKYIINIWQRVTEDFSPFDVDVTTADPFTKNNIDIRKISHCLITHNIDIFNNKMPISNAAGIAYVNIFGKTNNKLLNPALVYWNNIGRSSSVADVCSHEIGHHLGLKHDGYNLDPFNFKYYYGDADNSIDSWGPIMGAGFSNRITQWSKGEYLGANNFEDDIQKITNKLGLIEDDYGDTIDTSYKVKRNEIIDGIISHQKDIDMFQFNIDIISDVIIQIDPLITIINKGGYNLDINFILYKSDSDIPYYANQKKIESKINKLIRLHPGIYYLAIFGSEHYANKYSDYGSLGQYKLKLNINEYTTTTVNNKILYGTDNIILSLISKVNCSNYNLDYNFYLYDKSRKPYIIKLKESIIGKKNKITYNPVKTIKIKKTNRNKNIRFTLENIKVNDIFYIYIRGKGSWQLTYFTDYLNQITSCI